MGKLFGPLQFLWDILLLGMFLHLSTSFMPGVQVLEYTLLSGLDKQLWWRASAGVISANPWIPVLCGFALLAVSVKSQFAHDADQKEMIRERLQTVLVTEEKIQKGLQGTSHAYRAADRNRRGSLEEENRRLRQTIASLTREIQALRDRAKR